MKFDHSPSKIVLPSTALGIIEQPNTGERPPTPPAIDWPSVFAQSMQAGHTFTNQSIPSRPALLGSFLRAGDCGFVFAPRGVGKTWISLLMAGAIARGESLGEWEAGDAGPQRVCYIDGEVNLPDAIERAALVDLPDSVHWLHHEQVGDACGRGINLVSPAQQSALTATLKERGINVVILDNLSCLFRGMAENEADAWELVLEWLLELRREGITVIVVAHSGRNGEMRGTSRREDAAHWILKLEDASETDSRGARFKSRFTKNRNARDASASCPPLIWSLATDGGNLSVNCERSNDVDALVEMVKAGLSTAGELAKEFNVSAGTISKWAKRAEAAGKIIISERKYLPA